jgi:radical SAM/Cys-rich protein
MHTERDLNEFEKLIGGDGLYSVGLSTIQVNLGLRCNQCCQHCHVEASPERTEAMSWDTMTLILAGTRELENVRFDLTGGAPELNPNFRRFVSALRNAGRPVQVRTNLTVLLEPGLEDMVEFFREHAVTLVGSLPCYLEENVTAQRGEGVYNASIEAIRRLNAVGYGRRTELPLDLVYNPGAAVLPPPQTTLEEEYRSELRSRFGIDFTRLLTITNMPIGRFLADLRRDGREDEYMQMLKDAFNERTIDGLMCRRQISIGWDGTLSDCDFNLVLKCPIDCGIGQSLRGLNPSLLVGRRIATGAHCFGCTAGAGSSCGGALL